MTTYKLDTTGIDKLLAQMGDNVDRAVRETANEVRNVAANLAPVDTGDLRDSLEAIKVVNGVYWVQDGVEYGIYQELGTYKMAAQPFLVPAIEQAEATLTAKLQEQLGR